MTLIEQHIDETTDEDTQVVLNAYRRYVASDAIAGYHWKLAAEHHGLSSENTVDMAISGTEQAKALALITDYIRAGRGTLVSEARDATRKQLSNLMSELDWASHRAGISEWKLQDSGHCFKNFDDYQLRRAFSGELDEEDSEQAKKLVEKPLFWRTTPNSSLLGSLY